MELSTLDTKLKSLQVSQKDTEVLKTPAASNSKARREFCKENDIKIDLFSDEYFYDRLGLFQVIGKFARFITVLNERFNSSIDEYLDYRQATSNKVIEYLKQTPAYTDLNSCDMNELAKINRDIPRGDIYKSMYIGKDFLSIDIRRANYVALVNYSASKGYDTFTEFGYDFEKFMKQFTDCDYIQTNKRLREMIFGNLNGKRIATYEKYLIMQTIEKLESQGIYLNEHIVRINNDEFIVDITDFDSQYTNKLINTLYEITQDSVPVRIEKFRLLAIPSIKAYIKAIDASDASDNSLVTNSLVCINKFTAVLATKAINNIPIESSDLTFMGELGPAIYLQIPDLTIVDSQESLKEYQSKTSKDKDTENIVDSDETQN